MLWTIIVPAAAACGLYPGVFHSSGRQKGGMGGWTRIFAVGEMIFFADLFCLMFFSESVGKASRLMWINKSYVKKYCVSAGNYSSDHGGRGGGSFFYRHGGPGGFWKRVFGDGIHWTLVYLPLIYLPLIFFCHRNFMDSCSVWRFQQGYR